MSKQIDRTELAIWAEGTEWTTDYLVRAYTAYLAECERRGESPKAEARWANEEMLIPNH